MRHNQKTLFIFHTEFIHLRGGEKYVYEQTKRLIKKHTITLCVERINTYWTKKFYSIGVSIHYIWTPRHLYWLLLPLTFVVNITQLKKFISPRDTVFATSFPLSLLATFVTKKSIVFCFEPLSIFYDTLRIKTGSLKEKFFLLIIRFFYSPFDRLAVKRAKILATLNKPVATAIWRRYHRRPNVFIPNGVDTKVFCSDAPRYLTNNRQQNFVVGHSTDYTILKGTELLLRALPFVLKKNKNVSLLISESISNTKKHTQYLKIIKALRIQNHVHFVGCVPENKLPGFYTMCNVFCYCGSTRCIGGSSASLSVIEAESCGIPVLRTLGNTDEIVKNKTGFYFKNESPISIAKGILHYMSLPKKTTKNMGLSARKYCVANFSWQYSANKLASII